MGIWLQLQVWMALDRNTGDAWNERTYITITLEGQMLREK